MNKRKTINSAIAIILAMMVYLGLIALVGYAWDKSPTTIYQNQMAGKIE